jgi:hypothetical protein
VDHLIFTCPLLVFVWSVIREGLNWKKISESVKEFNDECLLKRGGGGDKLNSVLFFLFGAVCWTLWLNRNEFVFKNKIIPCSNAILYRLIYFMQRWTMLSSVKTRGELDMLIEAIKQQIPEMWRQV